MLAAERKLEVLILVNCLNMEQRRAHIVSSRVTHWLSLSSVAKEASRAELFDRSRAEVLDALHIIAWQRPATILLVSPIIACCTATLGITDVLKAAIVGWRQRNHRNESVERPETRSRTSGVRSGAANVEPVSRTSARHGMPPKRAEELSLELQRGVRMEFVAVPPGEFLMGSNLVPDTKPAHPVRITRAFQMGKYRVTQTQWEALMENNPSWTRVAQHPVHGVTWQDAQRFLRKLNERNDGWRYRLPTEAEWEYGANAGTRRNSESGSQEYLSSRAAALAKLTSTRSYVRQGPNAWGLIDMPGTFWEWCEDFYDQHYYQRSPREDPQGPSFGESRVIRNGIYGVDAASNIHGIHFRFGGVESFNGIVGFRCVRTRIE